MLLTVCAALWAGILVSWSLVREFETMNEDYKVLAENVELLKGRVQRLESADE